MFSPTNRLWGYASLFLQRREFVCTFRVPAASLEVLTGLVQPTMLMALVPLKMPVALALLNVCTLLVPPNMLAALALLNILSVVVPFRVLATSALLKVLTALILLRRISNLLEKKKKMEVEEEEKKFSSIS